MTAFYDAMYAMASPVVSRIYPPNEVPNDPGYPYAVLDVTLGRPDGYTLDATHGIRWCEVVVQVFSRTTNVTGQALEAFIGAVLDQRPQVAGWSCGPVQMELDPTVSDDDADEGFAGLMAVLSFTANKEQA